MKKIVLFLVLFSMLVGVSAFPMTVPFQGKLRAATAGDVNGTISMTFKLYDVAAGGVAFWSAVKDVDVNIMDEDFNIGVFSVLLGESVLLDVNSSKDLNFVGLAVGGNSEMVPRTGVGASPYSYRALRAGDSDTLGGHTAETIFEADTNIFISGVSDCPANEYLYGFNDDGTVDCRADVDNVLGQSQLDENAFRWWEAYSDGNAASGADGFVGEEQLDANWLRMWETYFDVNAVVIYGNLFTAIDNNHEVLSQAQLDENSFRWYETYTDGNASADGFISQAQVDENWMALWETYADVNIQSVWYLNWMTSFDANVSPLLGTVFSAIDNNHVVISQTQLDENSFRWYEAYTDGNASADGFVGQGQLDENWFRLAQPQIDSNIAAVYGVVFPLIDGNSGEDNVISVDQFDENYLRNSELYWDGNKEQVYGTVFPLIDGNTSADGFCDNNEDCVIVGTLNSAFDANVMDLNVAGDLNVFGVVDGNVLIESVPGSAYLTLQDWIDLTQSAGLLVGGYLASNGDGTITVTSGAGMVKTVDSNVGRAAFVSWDTNTAVNLADNARSTIYVSYNAGNPTINSTTTPGSISHTDEFTIGAVYRSGNEVHTLDAGTRVYDLGRRVQKRIRQVDGIVRASGLVTTETGTRNLDITAGVVYAGLNEFSTASFDSSGADSFDYWFYDGSAWIEGDGNSAIDNVQYNDVTEGLVDLTTNRYGVHWVYVHHDGHVDVVFGQGDYTLAQAIDAVSPSSLPTITANFATAVAKIIIQKGGASFVSVETPFEDGWTASLVDNHNDLGGIQGGTANEYYHLTSADYTELSEWIDDVTLVDGGDMNVVNIGVSGFYFGDGSKLSNLPSGTNTWVTELIQDQNWMKMWELFWDGNISPLLGTVFTSIDGNHEVLSQAQLDENTFRWWEAYSDGNSGTDNVLSQSQLDENSFRWWHAYTDGNASADGFISQEQVDENWLASWETYADVNIQSVWYLNWMTSFDANISPLLGNVFTAVDNNHEVLSQSQLDENSFRWYETYTDGNASADGFVGQGQLDENWMRLWETHWDTNFYNLFYTSFISAYDGNISPQLGTVFTSIDNNHEVLGQSQLDENSFRWYEAYTDGNASADGFISQAQVDENWMALWETFGDVNISDFWFANWMTSFDANISPLLGTVFTGIDGNHEVLSQAQLDENSFRWYEAYTDGNASADGYVSQAEMDANFYDNLAEVLPLADVNVSVGNCDSNASCTITAADVNTDVVNINVVVPDANFMVGDANMGISVGYKICLDMPECTCYLWYNNTDSYAEMACD